MQARRLRRRITLAPRCPRNSRFPSSGIASRSSARWSRSRATRSLIESDVSVHISSMSRRASSSRPCCPRMTKSRCRPAEVFEPGPLEGSSQDSLGVGESGGLQSQLAHVRQRLDRNMSCSLGPATRRRGLLRRGHRPAHSRPGETAPQAGRASAWTGMPGDLSHPECYRPPCHASLRGGRLRASAAKTRSTQTSLVARAEQ